jgi:hypothetical protein
MAEAEFLTARLDEYEAAANEVHLPRGCGCIDRDGEFRAEPVFCCCDGPAQALREVAAMRAVLRRCRAHMNEPDQYPNGLVSPRAALARQVLVDLTAIWSTHPDYQREVSG